METYYNSALKLGQKNYRACVAKGEYPYLPALDDMISSRKSVVTTDIGIVQVPAEFIVGTKTVGRTNVFAQNFMPIADEKSEFAAKWESLCSSHLNEGIRDPILVYEYMNRYYVEEGNKRVSVLKFFDAAVITARVKRIMPEQNEDINVQIYYEFVEFYKQSKINFIEFSKLGGYRRLQAAVGKEKEEEWNEDEIKKFRSTYYYFEKAYKACGGERLRSTVGDAMLACMRIYGYDTLKDFSETEMKKSVAKVWEEITLQQEENPIDVKLDPEDDKKRLLPRLSVGKKMKIAFLYAQTPKTSSWAHSHELGRNYIEKVFEEKIETVVYENVVSENVEKILTEAILDGANVIFATSAEMFDGCLRVAIEHPEVEILNCSLNKPHRYIRTYYTRMYEAKFITGAIAGAICMGEKIGYICKYPIYGTIAELNAFARGVQLTNPTAKIYLEWSSVDSTKEATDRLRNQGIDLISFRDFVKLDGEEKMMFGLGKVTDDGLFPLALPVWNWGIYYEKIIKSIWNGRYRMEDEKTNKSLNYYWGMSAGVVDMVFSDKLPKGVRYLGEILSKSICNGECQPFYNPSMKEDGRIAWETKEQTLSPEDVIGMDWLEENVVGTIPEYEQLEEKVQDVVDAVGITPARKEIW